MFPAMYPYYQKALQVYGFEKADGVGQAYDLVIQGFIRFTSITFFPVISAVTVVYFLVSLLKLLTLKEDHTCSSYYHTEIFVALILLVFVLSMDQIFLSGDFCYLSSWFRIHDYPY